MDESSSGKRVGRRTTREPAVDEEVSLVGLANVLLRERHLIVATPIVIALLVAITTLLLPRTFTASSSFMPQSNGGMSGSRLTGLAAQFGVSIPTASPGQSPEFYAELITSDNLLSEAVRTEYPAGDTTEDDSTSRQDLIDIYEVEAPTRDEAIHRAVEKLRANISVSTDASTGLVTLSFSADRANLAKAVADRLIDLVNKFNLETRQSQASAERAFVEERMEQARADLRTAEDSLRRFLENNRRISGSPQLMFERDRLQRRVELQQQVYTSLAQSVEQAKIEEVRNTPVITVVTPPAEPAVPDSRELLVKGVVALFAGTVIGIFLAFLRQFIRRSQQDDLEEYEEFRRLKRETLADIRGLFSRVRSVFARG